MSRPEHEAPPEIFYNETEAKKYSTNSRIMEIQAAMSQRALELLNIPSIEEDGPKFLLDIGCGSGLSGEILEEEGHYWIGLDISSDMLAIAQERDVEGDTLLMDMGDGLPFRPGTFDGAISISALQWLCNADKRHHEPRRRLARFFQTLYNSLSKGARAVFQFYPENSAQMEMITSAAMKCGFTGGLVVDYPHSTKAKKYFLCLFAGTPIGGFQLPQALGEDEMVEGKATVPYTAARHTGREKAKKKKKGGREPVKSKDWVMKKKEAQRKKGYQVKADSKYTARKRSGPRF